MSTTEFELSVRDIEGLSNFQLGTLPEWFAERLYETFGEMDDDNCSDAELVAYHFDCEWLDHWGAATIDGEEVFMFEYFDEFLPDELFEPAQLAEMLRCGLEMVESTHAFCVGTTAFFTERRTLIQRRTAGKDLAN